MLCSAMGPGFFMFFRTCRQGGGSGHGEIPHNAIIFVHSEEEQKTKKEIRKRVRAYQPEKPLEPEKIQVSEESIQEIVGAMVSKFDAEPAIKQYEIDYQEAVLRYEAYIRFYIRQMEEEDIALLMVFANV